MNIDKRQLKILVYALKTYRDMRKSMKLGDWKEVDQFLLEVRNEKRKNGLA